MSAYSERYSPTKSEHCLYIYIAGPMRGYPSFNFPVFFAAEEALCDAGRIEGKSVITFNPAANDMWRHDLLHMLPEHAGQWLIDHPEEPGNDIRQCMAEDTAWITKYADVVCVLPGWENSKGACAEVALARSIGARVWRYDEDELSFDGPTFTDITDANPVNPVNPVNSEVRTTSSTGGQKGVKMARFDLIPIGPLTALAEHYGRGALKYDSHQWRRGYEWSKSYAALLRHLTAFWNGEDWDVCPEDEHGCQIWDNNGRSVTGTSEHGQTCYNHTGSHHLDAVMWHALCLREFYDTYPEHDDRYKPKEG